jgi:membrane associated rhomboid family serine protease
MGGLIPLGDASRRARGAAFATLLIILVNVYVFFLELSGGERFVRAWSAIPVRITHGHHSVTLLTSMFLHASWMHIIGNMIFLWAFGPAMEDVMGHARYVIFYLAGGVTAMMAQILAAPNSNISCLGASGAIAAVMGAFIVTFPRDRIRTLLWFLIFFRVTYIPAVLLIGFWILTQIWNVGLVTDAQSGGVAYMAHVGGFAFGLITGRVFVIRNRVAFRGGSYA